LRKNATLTKTDLTRSAGDQNASLFAWADRQEAKRRVKAQRALRGAVGYRKGLAAEDQVIRHYTRRGAKLAEQRWRGTAGEIDLIFHDGDTVVCVEVKASRTHDQAAARLGARQIQRLSQSAEEFVGTCPQGSLTPLRVDVALVDGQSRLEILENAVMAA